LNKLLIISLLKITPNEIYQQFNHSTNTRSNIDISKTIHFLTRKCGKTLSYRVTFLQLLICIMTATFYCYTNIIFHSKFY
uniref:Ovule protein n=1 Tax=Strongyloides venezuelensis TaxID=75913 RepID=A0A0K0FLX0_STRVS